MGNDKITISTITPCTQACDYTVSIGSASEPNTYTTVQLDDYVTDTGSEYTFNVPVFENSVEFEDCMPNLEKVTNMCELYPALNTAFKNFKTIYKMVHQDYVGNHQEEDEVLY